jgi:hypothetical protein
MAAWAAGPLDSCQAWALDWAGQILGPGGSTSSSGSSWWAGGSVAFTSLLTWVCASVTACGMHFHTVVCCSAAWLCCVVVEAVALTQCGSVRQPQPRCLSHGVLLLLWGPTVLKHNRTSWV